MAQETHPDGGMMSWRNHMRSVLSDKAGLLLVGILFVGLILRLYGQNWDQGGLFHPDERSIYMRIDSLGWPSSLGEFLDAQNSPLNPKWFPLGSLVLYIPFVVRSLLAPLVHVDFEALPLLGRTIAAMADVGSIYMIYLLGARLFHRKVGILAAGLLSVAVIHIQNAHFYRPEVLLVFFVLTALWFMVRYVEKARLRYAVLIGLFAGLAVVSKISAAPLIFPILTAFLYHVFRLEGHWQIPSMATLGRFICHGFAALLLCISVLLLCMPYAILDFDKFLSDILWETRIAREAGLVPYTVQYIRVPMFFYDIRQHVVWGLGLPLGLMGVVGLFWVLVRNIRRPRKEEIILLLWVFAVLLIVLPFEVKFLRYLFPIISLLILFASAFLFKLLEFMRERGVLWGRVSIVIMVVTILATAFYAVAFESIYSRPHSAWQASSWINANIPAGTRILTDNHWDEGIPNLGRYSVQQLPMYDSDSPEKTSMLVNELSRAEYLLFYSNRTYGSIARVPERYPISARYYRLLMGGELGYSNVKVFTSYPSFLGVTLTDDPFTRANLPKPLVADEPKPSPVYLNLGYADENVMNYDHPRILIFRNLQKFSATTLQSRLTASDRTVTGIPSGAMLSISAVHTQREGGTWTGIFSPEGWAARFPVLSWLLLVELISIAALPVAFHVFGRLHDKGYLLAKTFGLLIASYVAWVLASTGLVTFSRASAIAGVLVLVVLSSIVLMIRWREMWIFFKKHWSIWVIGECVFVTAFLIFVAIRAANPDLWHPYRGGEKPMELAYLTAVLKSTTMPPYDPWFAGGFINYYYWGYFVIAFLAKSLGIIPTIAFNLAIPLLFALTVGGVFSLVYNLTSGLMNQNKQFNSPGRKFPNGPIAMGLVGVFLTTIAGNMDGLIQIMQGIWAKLIHSNPFPFFDFWRSTRMMPPYGADSGWEITEFPFFTFLFADLHPHLIAIPFAVLVLGLALALLVGLGRDKSVMSLLPTVGALSLAVGSLAVINTWDFPTYFCIALLVIVIGSVARPGRRWDRFPTLAGGLVILTALSFLYFLPFHIRHQSLFSGIQMSQWQTPIHQYLGIHLLSLFCILSFLIFSMRSFLQGIWFNLSAILRSANWISGFSGQLGFHRKVTFWIALTGFTIVGVVAVGIGYTTSFFLLLTLFLVLLVASTIRQRTDRNSRPYHVFFLILMAVAVLLGIFVEIVTVKGDIGRMNTVFKLYLQAWVLMSISASCAFWILIKEAKIFHWNGVGFGRAIWLGFLILLVLSVSLYPILGTRARLNDRFAITPLSLDGSRYMESAVFVDQDISMNLRWDMEAISWMQNQIKGSPVLLEAVTPQYRWGARYSTYTGLPAVLGWEWHQIQQRTPFQQAVLERSDHIEEIYSTTDEEKALAMMEWYDVKYVIVGVVEQAYYDRMGLQKFAVLAERNVLRSVYRNPGVTIYQVVD